MGSVAQQPRAPQHQKPSACSGCSLVSRGHGFVPAEGPENSSIVWWGEAPGYDEAAMGRPFIGAAGSMMERILRRNKIPRDFFRISNILQCTPPNLLLDGMPYQYPAIDHCQAHRSKIHAEPHKVYIAAGATPLKTLLSLHGSKRIRVEEFHGTVHWSEEYQRHIVPTFHPSFLQRGAHNLMGVVSFDLQVALDVAYGRWTPQPLDLVIDPDLEWWDQFVDLTCQAAIQDPQGVFLACDIETPDKVGGKPENELGPDDLSYQIDRWNFASHPDQGITIPNHERFRAGIAKLLALKCPHLWWNGSGYDWDRIFAAGYAMDRLSQYDVMLGAHVLQSDIPLSLGMWAPFYSRYGAWKHLSVIPGRADEYACIDGPQTHRTGCGVIGDLIEQGQWRAFQEDCHELLHLVLKPAQVIGVKVDKPQLELFHQDLETKQRRLLHEIQACVPDSLRPLTKETQKPVAEGVLHEAARTHTLRGVLKKDQPNAVKQELWALSAVQVKLEVSRQVLVCQTCGEAEVQKRHRCKDEKGRPLKEVTPVILPEDRMVVRYFWQEPFNPDSSKQMLGYLKYKKHPAGKNKKTKEDSADRETLVRLLKSTKDPFYAHNLDYRAVKKVDSTYAIPTLRRIEKDPESRLHPIPTFRPSTMRLSYVSPNITNVVGDKGGKENLAAGFRRCVVAAAGCTLAEFDFSGIEAVETGWYARAPQYVRLARLGIHAYLASHLLGRPADLQWSDADLLAYFGEIKKTELTLYDQAKRNIHGCVTGDHEVLTPAGWLRFDQLPDNCEIAVWAKDGTVTFEVPRTVTRDPHSGPMISFHGRAVSIFGTPEHRMSVRSNAENPYRTVTLDTMPPTGRLPTSGILEGTDDFSLGLQLAVAIQADGHIERGSIVRFHLRRERKICRLQALLDKRNLPYRRYSSKTEEGVEFFYLPKGSADDALAWLGAEKTFLLPRLLELTGVAKRAFLQETLEWDGATTQRNVGATNTRHVYLTTNAKNARTVQTIAHLCGLQSQLREKIREGRKPLFVVPFNNRPHARVESLQRTELEYTGTTYCVSVSTEHFLIRYRDRVFVSMNTNFGMTPYAMAMMFPHLYRDVKAAEKVQKMYFEICPEVPTWHKAIRQRSFDTGKLGGSGEVLQAPTAEVYEEYLKHPLQYTGEEWWHHPFQYVHHFWSVLAYKPITESQRWRRIKEGRQVTEINGRWFGVDLGEDSKRAIAFFPQSTAAGILKRSMRALFADPLHPSYIGDAYFGRTPLRAPIHDSLLLEIPRAQETRVFEAVAREMLRPVVEQPLPVEWGMGSHLAIGVEAKAGLNWKDVEKIQIPSYEEVMIPDLTESTKFGIEESDEDDLLDFQVVA